MATEKRLNRLKNVQKQATKTSDKSKRLIDANVLIGALTQEYHGMLSDEELKIYQVIRILDEQPTVDAVEVVHGRWIDRPAVKGQVYCSECATIEKSTDSNYRSRHCPNCGAKMDLKGE